MDAMRLVAAASVSVRRALASTRQQAGAPSASGEDSVKGREVEAHLLPDQPRQNSGQRQCHPLQERGECARKTCRRRREREDEDMRCVVISRARSQPAARMFAPEPITRRGQQHDGADLRPEASSVAQPRCRGGDLSRCAVRHDTRAPRHSSATPTSRGRQKGHGRLAQNTMKRDAVVPSDERRAAQVLRRPRFFMCSPRSSPSPRSR
jgi:hypothetical protein